MMKLITFKNYSGFKVNGNIPMLPLAGDDSKNHVKRAAWLTAMVESGGKFGAVMSYDGTGITAGLHQAIAVYPRELAEEDGNAEDDQGPLWKMLNKIRYVAPQLPLFDKIKDAGWVLAQDGTLRYNNPDGKYVFGKSIRKEFNGSEDGVTSSNGLGRVRSEEWVRMFVEAFSYPVTFSAQIQIGEEHIVKRAERTLCRFAKGAMAKKTIQDALYSTPISLYQVLSPEFDLAMCMFWSNTVNAPGAALKKLCSVLGGKPGVFPRNLIRVLGNTSFGRWDEDIPNGRYQRTRDIAMNSGLWPKELFGGTNSVMPKNMPG
jgi:hypothetical protein